MKLSQKLICVSDLGTPSPWRAQRRLLQNKPDAL